MAGTRPEVKVEEPGGEGPSAKQARSSSTTQLVALVSQLISNTNFLSTIRDFVRRVGVNVDFVEAEEKICNYLRAKLENACRE